MSKRKGRLINGIFVLNKPIGISSNSALQEVKRLFFAAKAGHAGSLDPNASGVLPISLGEATKFSQYLLNSDKTYEATIVLGCSTTTGDTEGEILQKGDTSHITTDSIEKVLSKLRGNIQQIPPMYSAIKHEGRRLYQLAREGKEVERKPRSIKIITLEQRRFRSGKRAEVDIFLICSKGTYVRSLAEDIGSMLGIGAHVSNLRRLGAGPYQIEDSICFNALREAREEGFYKMDSLLQPMDTALSIIPRLLVSDEGGYFLRQGQPVLVPNAPRNGMVRLAFRNDEFFGLGEVLEDGRIAPRKMIMDTSSTKASAILRG